VDVVQLKAYFVIWLYLLYSVRAGGQYKNLLPRSEIISFAAVFLLSCCLFYSLIEISQSVDEVS